jgi:hypothetical protein
MRIPSLARANKVKNSVPFVVIYAKSSGTDMTLLSDVIAIKALGIRIAVLLSMLLLRALVRHEYKYFNHGEGPLQEKFV